MREKREERREKISPVCLWVSAAASAAWQATLLLLRLGLLVTTLPQSPSSTWRPHCGLIGLSHLTLSSLSPATFKLLVLLVKFFGYWLAEALIFCWFSKTNWCWQLWWIYWSSLILCKHHSSSIYITTICRHCTASVNNRLLSCRVCSVLTGHFLSVSPWYPPAHWGVTDFHARESHHVPPVSLPSFLPLFLSPASCRIVFICTAHLHLHWVTVWQHHHIHIWLLSHVTAAAL